MQDLRKWIIGAYLILSGLAGLLIYYIADTLLGMIKTPMLSGRTLLLVPEIAGAVVAVVSLVFLLKNGKVNEFSNDVASELAKVTWPERKETFLSAGVVVIMLAICAALLAVYDLVWGTLIGKLYSWLGGGY